MHNDHEGAHDSRQGLRNYPQDADSRVQQALERSTRVDELLLKNEQEELQLVAQYADDLIRSEYRYSLLLQMLCSCQPHACKAFILCQALSRLANDEFINQHVMA